MRNAVGINCDQAHRPLARERAEPLHHPCRGQSNAPARGCTLDGDEVAVLRVSRCAGRDRQLASKLFLVDRREASTTIGQRTEDTERALPCAIDDLDDAAAVMNGVAIRASFFDAQQGAVADAGGFTRARLARRMDADFGRLAVRVLVPFGWNGDQLSVPITGGDVGDHDMR